MVKMGIENRFYTIRYDGCKIDRKQNQGEFILDFIKKNGEFCKFEPASEQMMNSSALKL